MLMEEERCQASSRLEKTRREEEGAAGGPPEVYLSGTVEALSEVFCGFLNSSDAAAMLEGDKAFHGKCEQVELPVVVKCGGAEGAPVTEFLVRDACAAACADLESRGYDARRVVIQNLVNEVRVNRGQGDVSVESNLSERPALPPRLLVSDLYLARGPPVEVTALAAGAEDWSRHAFFLSHDKRADFTVCLELGGIGSPSDIEAGVLRFETVTADGARESWACMPSDHVLVRFASDNAKALGLEQRTIPGSEENAELVVVREALLHALSAPLCAVLDRVRPPEVDLRDLEFRVSSRPRDGGAEFPLDFEWRAVLKCLVFPSARRDLIRLRAPPQAVEESLYMLNGLSLK